MIDVEDLILPLYRIVALNIICCNWIMSKTASDTIIQQNRFYSFLHIKWIIIWYLHFFPTTYKLTLCYIM